MTDSAPAKLIYIGDPMCSWCWGFAPVLEQLLAEADLPLELMLGGLRPGPAAEEVDDKMRRFLAHHWDEVEERTGQTFDRSSLEREGFVYDTEPPSVAVAAMREVAPEQTLPYFVRLQRAFYADGKDLSDAEVLVTEAAGLAELEPFMDHLSSAETRKATWEDFKRAHEWGVRGFPTLVGASDDRLVALSPGYVPYDTLKPVVDEWLGQVMTSDT